MLLFSLKNNIDNIVNTAFILKQNAGEETDFAYGTLESLFLIGWRGLPNLGISWLKLNHNLVQFTFVEFYSGIIETYYGAVKVKGLKSTIFW